MSIKDWFVHPLPPDAPRVTPGPPAAKDPPDMSNVLQFPKQWTEKDDFGDIIDIVKQILESLDRGETLVMYVADDEGNPK